MIITIITGLCGSGKTIYCSKLKYPILQYDTIYSYIKKGLDIEKINVFIEKNKLNKHIYLDAFNDDLIKYLIDRLYPESIESILIYTDIDDYYNLLAISEPRDFNQEKYDGYTNSIINSILSIKSNLDDLLQNNLINNIKYLHRKENKYIEYNNDLHLITILNETKKNRLLKYIDNTSGDKNYQSIILDNDYIREGTEKDWITLKNILKYSSFKNKIIYDTGCFNGYFSFMAIKEGAKKVIGIDHNKNAVDICKKISIYNNFHLWINGIKRDISCEKGLDFYELKIGKDNIFKEEICSEVIDLILVLNYLHHLKNELGLEVYKNVIDSFFRNCKEIIFEINESEIEYINEISQKYNFNLENKIESHRKTSFGNRWILFYKKNIYVEKNIINNGYFISEIIKNNNNFFIGRMPGIEAQCLSEYLNKNIKSTTINLLKQNTGFYCLSNNLDEVLEKWCKIYYESLKNCSLLFRLEFDTWDNLVKDYYEKIYVFSCASLHLWMPALEGKKILVISPFTKSIKIQFPKREHLFKTGEYNNFDYPNFDLQTLECPNTILGNNPFPHNNWLETFEYICNKINKIEFDIGVLGCGSYGMPLAHYIKKIGKSSIYAGAYTQVMFGIKGKRWNICGNPHRSYWNEYWKWPEDSEIPKNFDKVEGGCYWK